jgi:hypothetical protein
MEIKKIKAADFHLGNKLNGAKSSATYGVFRGTKQIGVVRRDGLLWNAWDMEARSRLIGYACGSLKQLKETLAKYD